MPLLAANLTTLFNELDFLDRFGAARAQGFAAVECLFPYAVSAQALLTQLRQHRLTLVQFNLPPGDWEAGDRGLAVDPMRQEAFRGSVAQALALARQLEVRQLHCMAGIGQGDAAHACYVGNLRYACAELGRHGIRVMIEPINPFDMPGYFLQGSDQAAAIIAEVGADNLFLQYDIYHMERMGVDHRQALPGWMHLIRHMQLADVPGRHEPGTGTIDWKALFSLIDRLGYQGHIGCEYFPAEGTAQGLGWRDKFL